MARIVARALKDEEYPPIFDDFAANIKDFNKIPENFKEYVYIAFVKGIISGFEDGEFKGTQNATRAQAAIMIQHLIDKSSRPKNVDGYYTEYMEPLELVKHWFKLEIEGKTDHLLQYVTKKCREKYGFKTKEDLEEVQYPEDSDIMAKALARDYIWRKEDFNLPLDVFYVVREETENRIKVGISVYEYNPNSLYYTGEPYPPYCIAYIERYLYKIDGLWYIDLADVSVFGFYTSYGQGVRLIHEINI